MRILLTNDDGIDAPGIVALFDALQGLGEIVPIAPKTVQSAMSHGITFTQPLMTEEVLVNERMRGTAVDGRPADCVKLALRAMCCSSSPRRPYHPDWLRDMGEVREWLAGKK